MQALPKRASHCFHAPRLYEKGGTAQGGCFNTHRLRCRMHTHPAGVCRRSRELSANIAAAFPWAVPRNETPQRGWLHASDAHRSVFEGRAGEALRTARLNITRIMHFGCLSAKRQTGERQSHPAIKVAVLAPVVHAEGDRCSSRACRSRGTGYAQLLPVINRRLLAQHCRRPVCPLRPPTSAHRRLHDLCRAARPAAAHPAARGRGKYGKLCHERVDPHRAGLRGRDAVMILTPRSPLA